MDFKVKILFSKLGNLKYISHLDLMRTLTRALRRSGLVMKFTQGFNPHPIFSIKEAIKLGLEAKNLEATFMLLDYLKPDFIKETLCNQLPKGLEVTHITVNA